MPGTLRSEKNNEPAIGQSRADHVTDEGAPHRSALSITRSARVTLISFSSLVFALAGILLQWASATSFVEDGGRFWVDLCRNVGTALLVTAVVTGATEIFIIRHYREFEHEAVRYVRQDVEWELSGIRDDIRSQANRFVASVSSLRAMSESGVTAVYASRHQASPDMTRDLMAPDVQTIRLIGISLNSFVRGPADLSEAWQHLEDLIRGHTTLPEGRKLDIKILMIDPCGFGAELRSQGESRTPTSIVGRLQNEAWATAEHLLALRRRAPAGNVSFDFRLYRIPPIFFLCHTDSATYLQTYYFWPSRHLEVETPNPVLKYDGGPGKPWVESLHQQVSNHFSWIWDHASIDAEQVLVEKQIGVDAGIHIAGAVNVFTDPEKALERMLLLLQNAQQRVYIQGVSLDSFFNQGNRLFEAVSKLADRKEVDVKCLILDPDCEQARLRAYREQLFVDPDISFEDFGSNLATYQGSALFRETQNTLHNIRLALLSQRKSRFQARLYNSAPTCFMLLVDDTVLVEQYLYGKISEGDGKYPVILGKQMPIVEYGHTRSPLYPRDPMRDPLKLLEDHFDFVFDKCGTAIDAKISAGPPPPPANPSPPPLIR